MNLKKKLAMAMAVAAVCSSIAVPIVANAGEARGCPHLDWKTKREQISSYTMHHGYSVGDDEYKDCVITTTKIRVTTYCESCGESSSEIIEEVTHSACGL